LPKFATFRVSWIALLEKEYGSKLKKWFDLPIRDMLLCGVLGCSQLIHPTRVMVTNMQSGEQEN